MSNRRPNIPLMQLAAGLLRPTPSGSFGASLGNGVAGLSKGLMYEDEYDLASRADERADSSHQLKLDLYQQRLDAARKAEESNRQLQAARKGYLPSTGLMQEIPQTVDPLGGLIGAAEVRDDYRQGVMPSQAGIELNQLERQKQASRESGLMMPDGSDPDAELTGQSAPMSRQDRLRSAFDAAMANGDLDYAKAYQDQLSQHKAQNLAPDSVAFNPMTGETVATNKKAADINKMLVPDGKGGWKLNQLWLDGKSAIAKAGAQNLTIDARNLTKLQTEEQKAQGKYNVDQFKALNEIAQESEKLIPKLKVMRSQVNKGAFTTGWGADARASGAKFLSYLGVPAAEEAAQSAEKFQAAANEVVLQKQMMQKGPQTENDAKRLEATTAQLGNTPEANKFIIDYGIALAQRDVEKRDHFRKWFAENETYQGAEDAWYKGKGGESIFDDVKQPSAATPNIESLLNKYAPQ